MWEKNIRIEDIITSVWKCFLYVFHTLERLIDSICMDLQSTKDISCFLIRLLLIKITTESSWQKPFLQSSSGPSDLLARWWHVFFLQCYGVLIFYLRNRGCRPLRPPSPHPALIHLQQILHRLTSSWISWGFVTVARWELISWNPHSVWVLKPKSSRYQSNWSRRKDSSHYVRDVDFLHDHSLWRGATWGARLWGDVTHIKRFETVSVWRVAGCSITPPQAANRQQNDERYNCLPNVA